MRTGRTLMMVALLAALLAPLGAQQTGIVMPMPKAQFWNNAGVPCNGCKLFSYAAGTTTKQSTYTDSALSVANTNPVVLDAYGRATVYLNPALAYKFVLAPPSDTDPPASAYYTQDNIVGPYSGVQTVNAADTRGLRVTRSAAEAGISLTSSGGSGKTYGIASMTTGELRIQDDSDSTPRLSFLADNVTASLAGTFTIAGGLFSVTGGGGHAFIGAVTGGNQITVRNTANGTGNYGRLAVGQDTAADALALTAFASSHATSPSLTAVEGSLSGGMMLRATHASGNLYLATAGGSGITVSPTMKVGIGLNAISSRDLNVHSSADGIGAGGIGITRDDASYLTLNMDDGGASTAWGSIQAGDTVAYRPLKLQPSGSVVLMPTQPAFLAYNSATDTVVTGATIDFDTEVYDTAGNFAADTFTAPVAGTYEFCSSVEWSDGGSALATLTFNISGVSYQFFRVLVTDAGAASGCVQVQMTATQTATVVVTTGDANIDIEGSSAPRITYFSGRLVQ